MLKKMPLIAGVLTFIAIFTITRVFAHFSPKDKPAVSGINSQNTSSPLPTVSATSSPTATPTPTATPSPIPTPTPKPKPTPSPLPTVKPYTSTDMDGWFREYSQQYNVKEEILKKIAVCESYLNPLAKNGPYAGLFQFNETSWRSARNSMGLDPHPNIRYDPHEAIKTAAFKIGRDGPGAWPSCSK